MHAPNFARNPYPTYEALRECCPVLHVDEYFPEHGNGGYWFVTRHEDVKTIVRDWRTYTSSVPGVTAIPMVVQRTYRQLPIEMDPPDHSIYRALISPVFRRTRVEEMHSTLSAIASDLVDRVLDEQHVDLVQSFAQPFSLRTLATFMELPTEDEWRWRAWVDRMFNSVRDLDDATLATSELHVYVEELIDQRLETPQDDFIGMLLESEVDGQRLSPEEVRAFMVVVLVAGHETSASAMAITLEYLARHPAVVRSLADRPELIRTAVEEFVRFSTPIQSFARNAGTSALLAGEDISAGDVVVVSFGSANRDPSAFDRADEVVLDRHPNRHLAFGSGPHLCVGAHVARLEMQVMLEQFSRRVNQIQLRDDHSVEWELRGDRRGIARLPVAVS